MGKDKVKPNDFNEEDGKKLISSIKSPRSPTFSPFRFASRMLREGAAGDHFIVPRTPFRMATVANPRGSNFQSRALSKLLGLWFTGI
jgi:hypothetical protein